MEGDIEHGLKSAHPAEALEALFGQYADPVYRLAVGLTRDPHQAEDVVQDTFLAVIKNRQAFENRSSLSTWIYRIAYNACIDRLRARIDLAMPSDDLTGDEDETAFLPQQFIEWRWTPEQMAADLEIRRELDSAIAKLSPSLRAVFILRDIQELSIEETARITGISAAAVKVRLHRARLALRESLAGYVKAADGGSKP